MEIDKITRKIYMTIHYKLIRSHKQVTNDIQVLNNKYDEYEKIIRQQIHTKINTKTLSTDIQIYMKDYQIQ